jgi:chaperonin GroEL (HSP60 family)
MLAGVDAIANAVRPTFGPRSRHVLLETGAGPTLVDDGLTIAQAVTLDGVEANLAADVLREAGERCVTVAGDGAASSMLLAVALIHGGFERIARGANPADLRRGFDRALRVVVQQLKRQSRRAGRPQRQLQVARSAGHDDTGVASIVVGVLKHTGALGRVAVEQTSQSETTVVLDVADDRGDSMASTPRPAATIYVGGHSEIETRSRLKAISAALSATRWAITGGIVAGGGVALLRTIPALERELQKTDKEAAAGVAVVMRALETPLRQLAANAGADPDDVIRRVKNESGARGFDVRTGGILDLFDAGIVDPTFLVCTIMETAVSIAGILMLADATLLHETSFDAAVESIAAFPKEADMKAPDLSLPEEPVAMSEAAFDSGLDLLDVGLPLNGQD